MQSWDRLLRALGDAAPRLRVRPPATETELVSTEVMVGARFPPDYRAWLAAHNGQQPDSLSILPAGGWFFSHDQIVSSWAFERGFDLEDEEDIDDAHDDDRVRSIVYHPKRIMIAGGYEGDGRGDATLLDLIPGRAGTFGQIIVSVSECEFEVVAPSLTVYFDRVAELVETKQLSLRNFDDGERLCTRDSNWRWEWLARGEPPPHRSRA